MRCLSLAVSMLLLGSSATAWERTLYDPAFFEPCEEVVSPHIKWARPLSGQAPKVLFITHRNAMREIVELSQRLSMDYTVFAMEQTKKFGETGKGVDAAWKRIRGNSAEELADSLRAKLTADYDVIVIGNLHWDKLPLDCRYAILKKVKAGAGLVGSIPSGRDEYITKLLENPSFKRPAPAELAAGIPFASLPAFKGRSGEASFLERTFLTARFKKGRIGLVRFRVPKHQMMTPSPGGRVQDCRLDYDYYLAAAAKLILWGADRESAVRLASEGGPLISGDRRELAGRSAAFVLKAEKPLNHAHLEFTIRSRRNRIRHSSSRTVALKAGENRITFPLPLLPRGSHFADLRVLDGTSVLAFGSVGLEVTSTTAVAAVTLSQDSFASGQPLSGKVTITNLCPGCSLRLTATDQYGRRLAEQVFPVRTPTVDFQLAMPAALTITGLLEAELLCKNEILDVSTSDYSINDRHPDKLDAQFVMWVTYPNNFIGPLIAEEFTRNGIDAQYGGRERAGYGPYANQWWLPYATRFVDKKTDHYQRKITRLEGDLVRSPCLTDPTYRKRVRTSLTKTAKAGRKYSTADFTLGDENHFVNGTWDLCFSDTCVADFRKWAQTSYGSLEALNASWGSRFTDWDDVQPRTLRECKKTGNYVPWVDHRLHMETVWADIHDFSRNVIREVVPDARVGYEGSDSRINSFRAADFWKLAGAMDLNNIYYHDFLSLAWHDFAPKGMLLGAGWFGGYAPNRNKPFMRWFPWRALFKGSNSFWVWAGYGHAGTVMSFDTSLYPFFKTACREIGEIKSGIGKLLITSRRCHDGIALLYSASSVHIGTSTPGFPNMNKTLDAFVKLLHDVGLECRVVSYAQLAAGFVTNDRFKALILPCAVALSRQEVNGIRDFVAGGGTVLADLRPGITDEHGKPYPTAALDDCFGVVHGSAFKARKEEFAQLKLGKLLCDASVRVTSGKAAAKAGDMPILISNRTGKGRTLLLNFSLMGYLSLPSEKGAEFADWPPGTAYREFMAKQFETIGITAAVTLSPARPHVEVARFRNGAAEYVGIIQSLPFPPVEYTNKKHAPPAPEPVEIRFGRKTSLFDVRAGQFLGFTDTIKTELTPGIAKLYALLPNRVQRLSLSAPRNAVPGRKLEFTVKLKSKGAPLPRVVHMKVVGPDRIERSHYAQNLFTETDRVDGTLPFALNDPPGRWTLWATDIATGVSGKDTIRLTDRK